MRVISENLTLNYRKNHLKSNLSDVNQVQVVKLIHVENVNLDRSTEQLIKFHEQV